MLEFAGVTRRYGDVVALDGLSFTVPTGSLVGFLGPNGAGKTTAMRAIFGISRPDEGQVRWRGSPITASDRRRFGYLPEERGLYPAMRIVEQLTYLGTLHGLSAAAARQSASRWLDELGLTDRAGDRLETLSLGNQQRVQLAAALVHSPELLVLDEPFSGLDPVGVNSLGQVLTAQAAGGVTVLFSSHQLDLVEHVCQAVAIIDHGHLVVEGAVERLTRSEPPILEISVAAPVDWVRSVPGVTVTSTEGDRVRLLLAHDVDPQDVLRAAQAAGPVSHFSQTRRRLSEVFLDAVGRAAPVGAPS
jgi:ABC-2 type transport system ATP-binding protein